MNIASAIAELDRVDWSFPSTGTRDSSIHTLHRFAGNFIPQIPANLVQILSEPGELVLDPFVGSGTTVVESLRLSRSAFGNDRTRACVFIANAKLRVLETAPQPKLRQQIARELAWPHLCRSSEVGTHGEGSSSELLDWFSPATLEQLRFIWKLIEATDPSQRPLLELIFSDVLFSSASTANSLTSGGKPRRHHWGWIADNVVPATLVDHDVCSIFVERLVASAAIQSDPLQRGLHAQVIHGDARSLRVDSNSVDLIVTSPPYAGMIDYSLAHRLLYLWMGWNLDEDRSEEIGARFKRKRRHLLDEYLSDMEQSWSEAMRVLKPGRACAVVLGESRKYPGAALRVFDVFEQTALCVWGPTARTPIRRRLSDREATDPVEFVAVFQKP